METCFIFKLRRCRVSFFFFAEKAETEKTVARKIGRVRNNQSTSFTSPTPGRRKEKSETTRHKHQATIEGSFDIENCFSMTCY